MPLSGEVGRQGCRIAIQRTLVELSRRDADVMLASNDGDFIQQLEPLVGPGRRTALLAFREFRNAGFVPLFDRGLEFHDLEYDVKAFNDRLPRIRIIPIDEFSNPNDFL